MPDWESIRGFHGHLGPWLVTGMKIGWAALEAVQARAHFGIEVDVWCPDAPPPSCMVDGLQWSTGATYGKRNIRLHPSDAFRVTVRNKDTGTSVLAVLHPDTPGRIKEWFDALGDEASSQRVWNTPNDELFTLEPSVP
jgi:formylmethanofuran dehydrogenase subunit E